MHLEFRRARFSSRRRRPAVRSILETSGIRRFISRRTEQVGFGTLFMCRPHINGGAGGTKSEVEIFGVRLITKMLFTNALPSIPAVSSGTSASCE